METRNLVGGKWIGAASGQELAVTNPATDEIVGQVPAGGAGRCAAGHRGGVRGTR